MSDLHNLFDTLQAFEVGGGGPGGDALGRGAVGPEPENDRAAGAGGFGGGPLGPGGFLGHGRGATEEPRNGISTQSRAVPIPEMGDAGVRDVQGGAAGHRDRA